MLTLHRLPLFGEVSLAARRLRRTPVFTIAVILVLGLGLGVGSGTFTFLNGMYFKPMAAGRDMVRLTRGRTQAGDETLRDTDIARILATPPRSIALLVGYSGVQAASQRVAIIDGVSRRAAIEGVFGPYFEAFGVTPVAGRLLAPADYGAMVAVISERLWQIAFNNDASVVGRTMVVSGQTVTIVGVAAAPFRGAAQGGQDIWVPAHLIPVTRLVGRLDTSTTLEQVNAELRARYALVDDPTGRIEALPGLLPSLTSIGFRDLAVFGNVLAIGLLVAAIAASSVALLFAARMSSRQSEMAIRLAVGATTRDLARAVALEVGLIAVASTFVAILVGAWLAHLVVSDLIQTAGIFFSFDATPDWRVVAYTAAAAALVVGSLVLRTSWMVKGYQALASMTAAGGISSSTLRAKGTPARLIVAQTIATTALLLVAALLTRSAMGVLGFSAGLDVDQVAVAWVDVVGHEPSRAQNEDEVRRVLETAREMPEVLHAAVVSRVPGTMTNSSGSAAPYGTVTQHIVSTQGVTPDAFRVLGLPIVRGRPFTDDEDITGADVVIVSENAAAAFWPGQDALGQQIVLRRQGWQSQPLIVVGVVADVQAIEPQRRTPRDVYVPLGNSALRWERLAVIARGTAGAQVTAQRLRSHVQRALPHVGLTGVGAVREEFERAARPTALLARVAGLLGTTGFVVAIAGLYGLTAHVATQRRREMGIRKALGATTPAICRMLAREAWRMLAVGIAGGVLLGVYARVVLGPSALTLADGSVIAIVAGVLFATGLAGSILPFLRVMRGTVVYLRDL